MDSLGWFLIHVNNISRVPEQNGILQACYIVENDHWFESLFVVSCVCPASKLAVLHGRSCTLDITYTLFNQIFTYLSGIIDFYHFIPLSVTLILTGLLLYSVILSVETCVTIHMSTHIHLRVHMHTLIHTHTHVHTHTYLFTSTCACAHTYTVIYLHSHIHTGTHMRRHSLSLSLSLSFSLSLSLSLSLSHSHSLFLSPPPPHYLSSPSLSHTLESAACDLSSLFYCLSFYCFFSLSTLPL